MEIIFAWLKTNTEFFLTEITKRSLCVEKHCEIGRSETNLIECNLRCKLEMHFLIASSHVCGHNSYSSGERCNPAVTFSDQRLKLQSGWWENFIENLHASNFMCYSMH